MSEKGSDIHLNLDCGSYRVTGVMITCLGSSNEHSVAPSKKEGRLSYVKLTLANIYFLHVL